MTGNGPAIIRLGGGQVLLRGPAVLDAARLVEHGVRLTRQRDNIAPNPHVLSLLDALRAEAGELMSAVGHSDVRDHDDQPPSEHEEITAAEAAELLGVTDRHIRRLAPDLGARKVGGAWVYERSAVTAYALAEPA